MSVRATSCWWTHFSVKAWTLLTDLTNCESSFSQPKAESQPNLVHFRSEILQFLRQIRQILEKIISWIHSFQNHPSKHKMISDFSLSLSSVWNGSWKNDAKSWSEQTSLSIRPPSCYNAWLVLMNCFCNGIVSFSFLESYKSLCRPKTH